ncbi:MAG: hypothetical protein ACTTK5_05630 [Candidatus Fimenecus sp.]
MSEVKETRPSVKKTESKKKEIKKIDTSQKKKTSGEEWLKYKGFPFLREGNVVYFGNPEDKFIVTLTIVSEKDLGDKEKAKVADKINVSLISTDPSLAPTEKILKTSTKKGFAQAMEFAYIWLTRELKNV